MAPIAGRVVRIGLFAVLEIRRIRFVVGKNCGRSLLRPLRIVQQMDFVDRGLVLGGGGGGSVLDLFHPLQRLLVDAAPVHMAGFPLMRERVVDDVALIVDDRMESVVAVAAVGEIVAGVLHKVRVFVGDNFALEHAVVDGAEHMAVGRAQHLAMVNVRRVHVW